MASTVTTLTKDVWTKVLTDVTNLCQVFIIDLDEEPTGYFIALVDTGASAPDVDFEGGVKFDYGFSPAETVASDFYIMPKNYDGKIVVLT